MKIVLTAAVLTLASAFMAQAGDLPGTDRAAAAGCVDFSGQPAGAGSAATQTTLAGQTTATGEKPCPQFLSTTTIRRARPAQRT